MSGLGSASNLTQIPIFGICPSGLNPATCRGKFAPLQMETRPRLTRQIPKLPEATSESGFNLVRIPRPRRSAAADRPPAEPVDVDQAGERERPTQKAFSSPSLGMAIYVTNAKRVGSGWLRHPQLEHAILPQTENLLSEMERLLAY